MDQTQELKSLIKQAASSSSVSMSSSQRLTARSPFYDAATEIGRGVERTTALLVKLAKLVNQQGLFDDPTEEINNMVFRIKQDIDALNKKCDEVRDRLPANIPVQVTTTLTLAFILTPVTPPSRPRPTPT
jgi:hypothetical protein